MKTLPPHHLRVPDERARLGAHEGHARVARLRGGARSASDADLILFNTCSIREKADSRLVGHLGEAKRLKARGPGRVVGVGGCWSQSVKEQVFELFPFVDVAFGPGPGPPARRVPDERQPHRAGLLRVRGLHRPSPDEARARVPGVGPDLRGMQLRLLVLHRALHARPRGVAAARRAASPRSSGSPATASARSRCWARTSAPTGATCRAGRRRASPSCSPRWTRSKGSSGSATRARIPRTSART